MKERYRDVSDKDTQGQEQSQKEAKNARIWSLCIQQHGRGREWLKSMKTIRKKEKREITFY